MSGKGTCNIAIIPAAGYKCTAERYYDTRLTGRYCPECLVPVAKGQTVLSRLCSQLRQLTYRPFVGVGQVGTIYPISVFGLARKHGIKQEVAQSPWTWKRVDEVAKYSIPILIHNPDDFVMPETASQMINRIGLSWDRMLMISGDYVISDALLKDLLEQAPWPSRVSLFPSHNLWLMTPMAATAFRDVTRRFRRKDPNTISLGFEWKEQFDAVWAQVGFERVHLRELLPGREAELIEVESGSGLGKAVRLAEEFPHKELP